ncbi:MAG TPA: PEP-CTERM-box response regulator transcription factor [Candidatus Cybelea sp.]|nr:PEP-CTERM-box response regulator transcription factor [Candidatus Cybelea sp.]
MTDSGGTLMFVEDDAGLRRQLAWSFSEFDVVTAGDRESAMKLLREHQPTVAVIDLGLPPDTQGAGEGLALLEAIRTEAPSTKVIVLTGNEDRAHAMQSISLGAYDFCAKPMDIDVLRLIVGRARHLWQLEEDLRRAAKGSEGGALKGVITSCAAMLDVCRLVEKIAPTDVTVMLVGESGTGKEVLARAMHDLGPRAGKPFVAINCGAIPENLLESELFGHEKGSFTGAVRQSLGKVELANHGTLLLDEIGDVPLPLQVKLLRFLQERVIERIGGRQLIPVDVRIICATNRNIAELIREQRFREDLYYRLNEFTINIPALRERPGDPVLLAHYFLNEFSGAYRREIKGFTTAARTALARHAWPGNVREMQNRIKRAVLIAEGDLITPEDLELAAPAGQPAAAEEAGETRLLTLKEIRQDADRRALRDALSHVNGNISQAAKILGISRPTLYDLMRIHNLKA